MNKAYLYLHDHHRYISEIETINIELHISGYQHCRSGTKLTFLYYIVESGNAILILRVTLVLGVTSILEIRPASLGSFDSVNSGGELRFPEATAAERKM